MERITFFERYRVSVDKDGAPRELSRNGAAITYKAIDLQSGEPVALKLIPVAAVSPSAREQFEERVRAAQKVEHPNVAKLHAFIVDAEEFVLVSEYPNGDSIASWVATHGPLAADATLRVALQVVSGLNAAAFHGLTHAAIDPANILIVPGQSTDGGWPAIKLMNLDTAGVSLLPVESDAPVATIAPQFASPEQMQNGIADFRSEIYSLGATMCFMLTGLAPLGAAAGVTVGEPRLPAALRRAPKVVRELIYDMLQSDPEKRPQDPVVFSERIHRSLAAVERKQARRVRVTPVGLGPLVELPARRVPTRPLAIAAALIALAILVGLLVAQPLRSALQRRRDVTNIGVPVGVPDTTTNIASNSPQAAMLPQASAAPQHAVEPIQPNSQNDVAQSEPEASAPVALNYDNADSAAQSQTQQQQVAASSPARSDNADANRIAANEKSAGAAPPAEGPSPAQQTTDDQTQQTSTAPANNASTAADANVSSRDTSAGAGADHPTNTQQPRKPATTASKRRTTAVRDDGPRVARGVQRARFVGTTPDGEWIFDAPSGQAFLPLPSSDDDRAPRRHRRERVRVERALPPDDEPPVRVLPALPPHE